VGVDFHLTNVQTLTSASASLSTLIYGQPPLLRAQRHSTISYSFPHEPSNICCGPTPRNSPATSVAPRGTAADTHTHTLPTNGLPTMSPATGEPLAGGNELQTSSASTVPTPTLMLCAFIVVLGNTTTYPESQVQFLSPDHLHELGLGGIALTVSASAGASAVCGTIARQLALPRNHLQSTRRLVSPRRSSCSSPTLVRPPTHPGATHPLRLFSPSRHKGPAGKCHPLCRTTMPPPRSCPFIRTACSSPPWPYAPTTIPWASPPFFHRSGKSQVPTPAYRLRSRQSAKHLQAARA